MKHHRFIELWMVLHIDFYFPLDTKTFQSAYCHFILKLENVSNINKFKMFKVENSFSDDSVLSYNEKDRSN